MLLALLDIQCWPDPIEFLSISPPLGRAAILWPPPEARCSNSPIRRNALGITQ